MRNRFPAPAKFWDEDRTREHILGLVQSIRGILRGKTNNAFRVTLQPGAVETRFSESRITLDTIVLLTPVTESASRVTGLWVENTVDTGAATVTIHHDSATDEDRVFDLILVG